MRHDIIDEAGETAGDPAPIQPPQPRPGDSQMQFVAWVWLGLVVGISFVATPVKFTADSLTRPVALDVGRATFHALNRIEWALALIVVVLLWRAAGRTSRAPTRPDLMLAGVIVAIVMLQTLWLLPELDARVAMIIAGDEPPPSVLHTLFGVVEIIKVVALGVLGHRSGAAPTQGTARDH